MIVIVCISKLAKMIFFMLCGHLFLYGVEGMVIHEQTDGFGRPNNINLSSISMIPLVRRKRLTGGIDTFPQEATMVGSLQRKSDRTHFCGVTLLTLKHGITACSCVIFGLPTDADLPQGTDFIVMAGDKNWNTQDKTRIRDVKSFWRDYRCRMDEHAGIWKFGVGYFELALPFPSAGGPDYVSELFKTQAEYEKAFRQYYENVKYSQGSVTHYCYTYGWGAKKYDVKMGDPTIFPEAINKRAMQFLTMKDCQDRLCSHGFCSFKIEKIGAVCLGVPDNSNGGVCKGDAGNPLMCGNVFFGVGEEAPDCGNILRFAIFYKLDIGVIQTLKKGAAPSLFSHSTRTQWIMICLTLVIYVTV